jgi:hypothetical protein
LVHKYPDRDKKHRKMTTEEKSAFDDRLQTAYCPAMIRQKAFGEYLNGRNWNLDLKIGIVKFGDDLVFPIQLLGSYSELEGTWLWCWDNPGVGGWPQKILEGAQKLRDLGGIFNLSCFPLEHISGHEIAMVCSELLGQVPYYRGPYANGALFFLVQEIPEDLNVKLSPGGCVNAMMDALGSQFIHDHSQMCRGCLMAQNFELEEIEEEEGGRVIKGSRDHEEIMVAFDEEGLLVRAEASL